MHLTRDRLEPRDWRRPWRDRPGFFFPGCDCCGAPACTPACIGTGTVGSESGSECSDCGSNAITDNFGGSLDAAWIEAGASCKGNGIGALGAHTSGGILLTGGGAGIIRPFARPALSGFCVQVKVTIAVHSSGGANTNGIVLAYGPAMFARNAFNNYGRRSCTTSEGCTDGAADFQVIGGSLAANDVIEFILRDEGGGDLGDGSVSCSICYQLNGTTLRVDEGCVCCFPATMYAGIVDSAGNGIQWDDFIVNTN